MTFVRRQIDVQFQLGSYTNTNTQENVQRTFKESGTDTSTLSGLRTSARIVKAGSPGMNELDLQVKGMTLSQMNQLNTYGLNPQLTGPNFVIVSAGDADSGKSVVFRGAIKSAWSDFQGMPDTTFRVEAFGGLDASMTPIEPTSFQGSVDAATIMENLAGKANLQFENSGVSKTLVNPYFAGSVRQQMYLCARDGGFPWLIDDDTLAIWPAGGSRNAPGVTDVGPDNGLVGYPTFTSWGISARVLFNKSIRHGAKINVTSQLQPASGVWVVQRVDHDLEAEMPNGHWFSTIYAARDGLLVVP